MYLEGKKKVRFLLSAKQFNLGGSIYISSSEDFPALDSVPRSGYLARVERQRDDSFLLCLNQCHLCDVNLGFFHCGRMKNEREVIARMYHYYRSFKPTNVEYRCVNVMIPSISKNGKRKIWCPRAFHRAHPNLGYENDVNTALSLCPNVSFRFENSKPVWNEKTKSLVVKFQSNRVLIPSTRNFLLCTSWDAAILSANQLEAPIDAEDEDEEEEDESDEQGDEEGEIDSWEDGNTLTNNSCRTPRFAGLREKVITPYQRGQDIEESDAISCTSSKSGNTMSTQPLLGSPIPKSRRVIQQAFSSTSSSIFDPSSTSPPSGSPHTQTTAALTFSHSQPMPYPPSVSSIPSPKLAISTAISQSQSLSHQMLYTHPYNHPAFRPRSESSIDSESTITASSATPTKFSSRHQQTSSSSSNLKAIQIGSPSISNAQRKRIVRAESKVLGK